MLHIFPPYFLSLDKGTKESETVLKGARVPARTHSDYGRTSGPSQSTGFGAIFFREYTSGSQV